jgi:hypothetical protein
MSVMSSLINTCRGSRRLPVSSSMSVCCWWLNVNGCSRVVGDNLHGRYAVITDNVFFRISDKFVLPICSFF